MGDMAQDYELLKDLIQDLSQEVKDIGSKVEAHHNQCMESFHDLKVRMAESDTRRTMWNHVLTSSGPLGLVLAIVACYFNFLHR